MKSVLVKLNGKEDVCGFVNTLSRHECDFDLVKGKKVIDAKSYLGVMCFDFGTPLRLDINENSENVDGVLEELSPYII